MSKGFKHNDPSSVVTNWSDLYKLFEQEAWSTNSHSDSEYGHFIDTENMSGLPVIGNEKRQLSRESAAKREVIEDKSVSENPSVSPRKANVENLSRSSSSLQFDMEA